MENLKKVETLIKTSKSITTGIDSFRRGIKDSSCDKHGMGFNKDSRFSSASFKISVDSWKGYYGSSSCSTHLHINDTEAFWEHFIKYLNRNFDSIMKEVADSIMKEAVKKKEGAKNELLEKLQQINELEETNV